MARRAGQLGPGAIVTVLGALLLAAPGVSPADPAPARFDFSAIEISTGPVDALDPSSPGERRFGRLTYLGGLVLSSADGRFGGFSGLSIAPDRSQLLTVSDRGFLVRARLTAPTGPAEALVDVTVAILLQPSGEPVSLGYADAEALWADWTADGPAEMAIAFEGTPPGLWTYSPGDGGGVLVSQTALPGDVDIVKDDKGFEAMTQIGSDVLLITEDTRDGDDNILGWIGTPGEHYAPLRILRRENFQVTGVAALQNGDLLLLERRFSFFGGFSTRLRLITADALRVHRLAGGAPLDGEDLATFSSRYRIGNAEGLAVLPQPDGDHLIYVISDDNYSPLQETLLLTFRLAAG